jgi:hypothetical protein
VLAVLAYTAGAWTQVIVALSIFVPVIAAAGLTIWVLRGAKHDPDENRWRRQAAAERLRADAESGQVARRVDVGEE